jgi:hypothetical protein
MTSGVMSEHGRLRVVLMVASWLLGLLAVASVAVLVGGRDRVIWRR